MKLILSTPSNDFDLMALSASGAGVVGHTPGGGHCFRGSHGWAPQNKCAGGRGGGRWCHRPWQRYPSIRRCPSWVLPPPSGPIRGGPPVDLKHVRCRRRATPQLETMARWPGRRRDAQAGLQGLERPRGSLSHADVRFGHRGYGSSRLSDSACSPDFKK